MKKTILILCFLLAVFLFPLIIRRTTQPQLPADPVSPTASVLATALEAKPDQNIDLLMSGEISPQMNPALNQIAVDELRREIILDRRITELGNGDVQRLFLVKGGGTYPYHRIEELLRWDKEQNAYLLLQQSLLVADHVLVKLSEEAEETELEKLNQQFGTRTLKKTFFPNKYIVQLPKPSIDGIFLAKKQFSNKKKWVERVHLNPIHAPTAVPNDPDWEDLWGKQRINCTNAWDTETGSTNIIVAVIDTGVDLDHPDLGANIWRNPGEAGALATNDIDDDGNGLIDDWIGWDFGRSDNNPDDNGDVDYDGDFSKGGHGTHCSGIIGAIGNNSNQIVGVCWNVRIMALKACQYFSEYNGLYLYAHNGEAAMKYATDNGAKVTSNSYGGPGDGSAYLDGVSYQNSNGVICVAAAGNDATDTDQIPYQPAGVDCPNVIAVASSDSGENLSSFSNYGETTVDIVAPGSSILSTLPGGTAGSKSGTSMAAPQIAGAAALLFSAKPEINPLFCKELLLAGVEKFAAYSNKCVADGRMNIHQSLKLIDSFIITEPNKGSIWLTEHTQTVSWLSEYTNTQVKIDLFHGTTNLLSLSTNALESAQQFAWVPPQTLTQDSSYRIRLTDVADTNRETWSDSFSIHFPSSLSINSTSFFFAAQTDQSDHQTLIISNEGAGDLTFDLVDESDFENYTWLDSDAPDGPTYSWIDISSTGIVVDVSDDDESNWKTIGFDFPFYDSVRTKFVIADNGGISFTMRDLLYENMPLPSEFAPSKSLLAFWDDLETADGTVLYHSTPERLVVSWLDVPEYDTINRKHTFQIIIYPSGKIIFQYNDLYDDPDEATIGIQFDRFLGPAVQVAHDETYLKDNFAIEFTPPTEAWVSYIPESGTVAPGASTSIWLTASATNLSIGVHSNTVTLSCNDVDNPETQIPLEFTVTGPPGDVDGDNLPDSWETQYYGGPTNAIPTAMASNNLNTVYETYIAGLNPTNSASIFLTSVLRPPTSDPVLQWNSVSGRVYNIWWTSNLLHGFQSLETNLTGGAFTDTNHNAHIKGFYKINVRLEP